MMVNSLPCDPEVARMVEENRGLVYRVLQRSGLGNLPKDMVEEMAQEGMIGLFKAACTYDESKGAFSTHATWWIRGQLSKEVYRYSRQCRTPEKPTVSLQNVIWASRKDGETIELEDRLRSNDDVEEQVFAFSLDKLKSVIEQLTESREMEMFLEYAMGEKQADIAQKYGVTRQCVSRQIIRAKKKMEVILRRMGYG